MPCILLSIFAESCPLIFSLAGFLGPVSTPISGIHEMQIGPIKFQSVAGDITKENTDVIVNVTSAGFNAKSGT